MYLLGVNAKLFYTYLRIMQKIPRAEVWSGDIL